MWRESFLRARGYQAKGGQIVDASIVEVPRQGNSKGENAEIKAEQGLRSGDPGGVGRGFF